MGDRLLSGPTGKNMFAEISCRCKIRPLPGFVVEVANGNHENISVNASANNWGEFEP
jgi:hypothetical protein